MHQFHNGTLQKAKLEYRVLNNVNGAKRIDWIETQIAIDSYDETDSRNSDRFFSNHHRPEEYGN